MFLKYFFMALLILSGQENLVFSQNNRANSFRIVPLGVKGGIDESNLSAYMVAVKGTHDFVCLDAGTLNYGIEKAISNNEFSIPADEVIKNYIKGYCISHAHLDHISGLIINSPADSTKNIYALSSCIEAIKKNYFNWESWANFSDEGKEPFLKKYHFRVIVPDSIISISNTQMNIQPFILSHSNVQSTAFLINHNDNYLLYLGDTGPDLIEKSNNLHALWEHIAPLIKNNRLEGIFIEVSFPDEQPDSALFGHLTPQWLMKEMHDLEKLTGKGTLNKFNIIVTHQKPPKQAIEAAKSELVKQNDLHLHLIFPQQGKGFNL